MDVLPRIRPLSPADLTPALALVWEVFLEFEAPGYADEGVQEFLRFIDRDTVAAKLETGGLRLWGCFEGERVVGVVASRAPCHIALLFVRKDRHRQGIARALFDAMRTACEVEGPVPEITVNSSPYAVEAYRHLGFVARSDEQVMNGIRFVPMRWSKAAPEQWAP